MDENAFWERWLALCEAAVAVIASWQEWPPRPAGDLPDIHIAVAESDFAAFYGRRWAWLETWQPLAYRHDLSYFPARLQALTAAGDPFLLTMETWGGLPFPQRPAWRLLFDRSGRLATRLRERTRPRLEYQEVSARQQAFAWQMARYRRASAAGHHVVAAQALADARRALWQLATLLLQSGHTLPWPDWEAAVAPTFAAATVPDTKRSAQALQKIDKALLAVARHAGWPGQTAPNVPDSPPPGSAQP